MLFYLVLRALDTIEDDMTIPLESKDVLLRNFYTFLDKKGWTFTESTSAFIIRDELKWLGGPNEKDRQLLVEFDVVIEEYQNLNSSYKEAIQNITKLMGNGMAEYAGDKDHLDNGVNTLRDFDLYCHYVAGLVGEGLSKLFATSKVEDSRYASEMDLSNAMGLFLQKTNIIRDFREDLDDGRLFWPKQIWSKYCTHPKQLIEPGNEDAALHCISDMTANVLFHATDSLLYLSGLRDQSVFNFCAIPQVMAIATLALVFRNKNVMHKNVKIRKGQAVSMLHSSTNLRAVSEIFLKFTREIHRKNVPNDPNFLAISVECGRIEQWIETVFPHAKMDELDRRILAQQARSNPLSPTPPITSNPANSTTTAALNQSIRTSAEQDHEDRWEMYKLYAVIGATWLFMIVIMLGIAWLAGARFDLAIAEFWQGISVIRGTSKVENAGPQRVAGGAERVEL